MSGGTRSFEMGRRLVDAGHEVHVITTYRDASDRTDWYVTTEAGMVVHWLPLPYNNKMGVYERISAFLRFAFKSAIRAGNVDADLVFASSTPLTIAIPAVYASRKLGAPMVFEVRDLWPELPIAIGALKGSSSIWLARQLERFAYRNSSWIVALSPGMKDGIIAAGYPSERISVIPNGCDIELFRGSNKSETRFFELEYPQLLSRKRVCYAGTLGKINGVDYLVDVAAEAKAMGSDICFMAIGDGAEADRIRQLAIDRNVLNENFFMFAGVAKERMPSVLAATDLALSLFVDLPEMWANSANKFFDALASATPIAINYQGWQAEILLRHDAGVTLPSRDANLAAKIIIQRLSDDRWIKAAGENALSLAEGQFNRNYLAAELDAVLRRVGKVQPS